LIHSGDFPQNFYFGAATAAFQVEGGWNGGGKGLSTWDVFMHQPKYARHQIASEFAVDTYHDYFTDIDMMSCLGLNAYRFSISWPRVLPEGRGSLNPDGLNYYQRLVDEVLQNEITPFVTLFHWDMPQALYEAYGGFYDRQAAYDYAEYVQLIVKTLGDRVKYWITLNEPWEHAMLGYFLGEHAPGRYDPWAYFRVAHHQLLGHGLAVERIKALYPEACVGITLSQFPVYPFKDTPKDRQAAHFADQFVNRFYLDGVFRGKYPDELWRRLWLFKPPIHTGDMEIISHPFDFLGVNYYSPLYAYHDWRIPFFQAWIERKQPPSAETIEDEILGAGPRPSGLYELAMRYRDEYGNPAVFITENGVNCDEWWEEGYRRDPYRQRFLELYLEQLARAIKEGADIRGYFVWSWMDLCEWTNGYDYPMGLVHVNHATQQRTLKDSAFWYGKLARGDLRV
jgi:beta-glucosidase